jgi:phthiocerol/phenolphthiocerol synthesis type-I polyketide synthase E
MLEHEFSQRSEDQGVAIIGMSGRFPGANSVKEFWQNLVSEIESIKTLTDAELLAAGVSPEILANPKYVKRNAHFQHISGFDADFFGYSGQEAEIMDPQHRWFLQCVWEAFEDAGVAVDTLGPRTGVFAGTGFNNYLWLYWDYIRRKYQTTGELISLLHHNAPDHLSTRVSHAFNLMGPSITIQSACSTSLVAVHYAVQSLLLYETNLAVAGGVSILLPHEQGYLYQTSNILSVDGHCRAFDAQASGTIFGSGVGVVLLKRLADAIKDRNIIYAVIKGSAVNNDGSQKMNYTSPSIDGQAQVISEALEIAEILPSEISFIETHGTGTSLGDPIEFSSLQKAYNLATNQRHSCALGAVKTNIGHLNAAAGVAGIIKSAMALYQKILPATLHYNKPNPAIDFESSPFYINTKTISLPAKANAGKHCAGVSSFGIGGTNAHVILQEAPKITTLSSKKPYHIILLSARTQKALQQMKLNLNEFLNVHQVNIADLAYTLQIGRKIFSERYYLIGYDQQDVQNKLMQDQTGSAANNPYYYHLQQLGDQWLKGMSVNWREIYVDESRCLLSLPTYPFELQDYWLPNPLINESKLYPRPDLPTHYQAPQTDIEKNLTDLWQSLLGIERIGVHDNFYALGGDSLLMTQLLARLEQWYPIIFTLDYLEKHSSIMRLAEYIEKNLLEKLSNLSAEEINELLQN